MLNQPALYARTTVSAFTSGVVAALLLLAIGCAPAAAKKIALVIGNGAYKSTIALANPVQDARSMAEKLGKLGFDVISGYDKTVSPCKRPSVNSPARRWAPTSR